MLDLYLLLRYFTAACPRKTQQQSYGGYGLSFTISVGLAASATSTYLMLAGGYILLLGGIGEACCTHRIRSRQWYGVYRRAHGEGGRGVA